MTAATIGGTKMRQLGRLVATALAALLLFGCLAASALAAPVWRIVSSSSTTVAPGGQLTYFIDVVNVGDVNSDGTPYPLTITLPPGFLGATAEPGAGSSFSCPSVAGETIITCDGSGAAFVGIRQELRLTVDVDSGAIGVKTATFEISGGGAPSGSSGADAVTISDTPLGFGIDAFDGQVTADAAASPFTQAGGHPFGLSTAITFNAAPDSSPVVGGLQPLEPVKNVVVDLPPGLVGNPTGATECTGSDLANTEPLSVNPRSLCAPTSQVGTALVVHNGQAAFGNVLGLVPVFNMVPPPNVPARFGINVLGTVVVLDAQVRTGSDYGLRIVSRNTSEGASLIGTEFDFWGVPSDASHDHERSCPGQAAAGTGGPTCGSGAPRRAFFRNPTTCTPLGVGLTTTARVDSWLHPGDFKTASFVSHDPPGYPFAPVDWGAPHGPDGCEVVPFDPLLQGQPLEGSKAGGPVPFTFDLTIPQSDDPDETAAQSDLRKAVVTLPAGVRVSASSASGLQACSSAQIALRSDGYPSCPEASKIGALTVDTPLLDVPVTGGIYLAKPFDNPFNSLLAIYLVARAKGVVLKLAGHVATDPRTGQITTTFDDNPQLPFSRLHLEFKTGPRTPLALPNRCGTYTTHAVLTGWNGRTVASDSSFSLSENARGRACPPQFSPGFSAGTESNSAGSSSAFLLRFTRDDEDQALGALTVNLPRGLTGKIANVQLCANAAARAGSCSAGSKIGDVTVGAGAGSDPFFITNGRAYLTGPYKGAPFGVSIVVPAVAGPFDLGTVTVRSALFVDKHDATVRIVSDPLPTILQGIPLDVRDVRVNVNKPDFFINPTSCAVKRIGATLTSTEGRRAAVSDRFQAAECGSLSFRPRMVMRVGGKGHTRRGQTSAFTTRLTMPSKDQANLKFVRVSLPTTINARLNTINDACTRAEFEADIAKCAHAVAGSAAASTPLLRAPLRGKVYFVKNGHPIPDLFVALRGQVSFDLIGRITLPGGKHLATTFATAPDVPIRSFTLRLLAGARTASIGAARNLCSAKSRRATAAVDYIAQNGRVLQLNQRLRVAGCKKARGGGRHTRH